VQLISICVSALTIVEAHYALGRHLWTVPPEDALMQIKILYGVILGYNFGLNVVKICFLLFYLRIFQSNAVRTISKWFLAYVGLWTVTQMILLAVACMPIAVIVPSMQGRCLDTYPVWLVSSIMSTLTDFVIFALPLPSVAKLKLRRKQKIVTVFMFSLGFFTCIVSILRIFTLKDSIHAHDPTWDNVGTGCWSIVELNCAILCSCLPTLRPLVVKYYPGFASSRSPESSYNRYRRTKQYVRSSSNATSSAARDGARFAQPGDETAERESSGSTGQFKTVCYSGKDDEIELVRGIGKRDSMGILVTTETESRVRVAKPERCHERQEESLGV
jgi:hypothetical protein